MNPAFRCAALLAASLCPAATLLRAPYLQNVGPDRATVLWVTREPVEALVEYSADGKLWQRSVAMARAFKARSGETRYQHQADLRGLSPGSLYHYRLLADGSVLRDGLRFRTAAPGAFTFLVLGDSGTGSAAQHEVARRMAAEDGVGLVLHVGDICQDDGALDRLEAHYFDIYAPLMSRVPFFPTLGNHDYGTDLAAPYLFVHVLPASGVPADDRDRYYSFDWGDVHFVSLDSNLLVHPLITARMLHWLENDLARTRAFWKIAFFHHPPYPSGHHLNDPISAKVRELILPVLERHGVQVTFSGHEHNYQRSKPLRGGAIVEAGRGMVSFVTGGGGAHLHPVGARAELAFGETVHHYLRVEVEGWRMRVVGVAADGRVVDRVALTPAPELASGGVVNAGSFTPRFAPGSLISVFGYNLGVGERAAPGALLPAEIEGVGVSLNERPVSLLFISPNQINAQLPYGVEGPGVLRVRTPNGLAEASITVTPAAPAILRVQRDGSLLPAILRHPAGVLVSAQAPALPGETLLVYLTGLGVVEGPATAGHPAPGPPPLAARHNVEVRLGELTLRPFFAGLVPGFVGLYQVNVRLPDSVRPGMHALRVIAAGAASEPVLVPVEAPPPAEELGDAQP